MRSEWTWSAENHSMGSILTHTCKVLDQMPERNSFQPKITKLGEWLFYTLGHPCVVFVCSKKMFGVKKILEGDLYLDIRLQLCKFILGNAEGSCMDGMVQEAHIDVFLQDAQKDYRV